MWDYTEKVRDHYLNPRNVGEVEAPDGVGEVGNITCGDALRLTFKLDSEGKITDIKFKTFGCGSAIASASALTELVKGKSIEEASTITNKQIAEALGGLPKAKMHCSVMGQEALEAAIDYYKTGGKTTTPKEKEGTVICTCFGITDKEVERAIKENNLSTVEDVTSYTKAGGGCGGCHPQIQEILNRVAGEKKSRAQSRSGRMTTIQKIDKIREVIQKEIKPTLVKDGGDCELVDVEGNNVYIQFKGHCAGCAFSSMTLKSVVEKKLQERVSEDLTVQEAQ
ncbi:MAG: Fe-S cluster assembly protein NifU [Chitinivibrionales bacterium]|nr:Fe-S cluster assembly protein NifU [Chitinivibrionales bacterium]